MIKIKQLPEDFIVKEISSIKPCNSGRYAYFLLKKRNYSTIRAVQFIANKLNINRQNIGYAGNKDKDAVTEQIICIDSRLKEKAENISIKEIELKFLGYGDEYIYMGNLIGNGFEIVVRNLAKKEADKVKNIRIKHIPNYFGEQRFSVKNAEIGKAIVKKDFKKAAELIIKTDRDVREQMKSYLDRNLNDFIGALRLIDKKVLKLYIHAYQSRLFNKAVEELMRLKIKQNVSIPLMGFGTEFDNYNKQVGAIINKLLKKEKIDLRDFIIKQIPEIAVEGSERDLFAEVKSFKVVSVDKDELSKNKFKAKVSFELGKGSYGTEVVKKTIKP